MHLIDFSISTRVEGEFDVCSTPAESSAAEHATTAAELEDFCTLPVKTQGYEEYFRAPAIVGTPAFASLRQLEGGNTLQIDDVESLVYSLTFLAAGSLPWLDQPSDAAIAWKRKVFAQGWDETLGGTMLSCSDDVAAAVQALWSEVVACRESPGTRVNYDACIAALQ